MRSDRQSFAAFLKSVFLSPRIVARGRFPDFGHFGICVLLGGTNNFENMRVVTGEMW